MVGLIGADGEPDFSWSEMLCLRLMHAFAIRCCACTKLPASH